MKNVPVFLSLLGLFPWLSSSCFQSVEDVENELEKETSAIGKTTLKLTTRSATGVINYPVFVLAYDEDGNKAEQQILTSADDQMKMSLPVGTYRISAITGYEDYIEPSDYDSSDAKIGMPVVGYVDTPLFVGMADVELKDKATSVEVVMSSRSASVDISLSGLPATTEAVSVALSRQYSAWNMEGVLSSPVSVIVDCVKEEDVWSSGTIYVFPGADAQTVLTISVTDNTQQYSYGYTVKEPLAAGVPYILKGKYKGGESVENFDLSGSLTLDSWKDPRAFNFEFGEGASTETEEEIPVDNVSSIPEVLSLWDGHVVAKVEMNEAGTEADVLLVSLQEYTDVYSANVVDHEQDAKHLADAYTEGELTGWKIPSASDMQQLKELYKDENMESLNIVLEQGGGAAIRLKDAKGNSVRYLCDNATQAIGFSSGSNIGKAGKTVKYALRLVKKVHVTQIE